MRSYLVALIIFGSLPFFFKWPHFGLYIYTWVSLMNPHRLTWGFAYDFQFALITGATMFLAWLVSSEPKKYPVTPATILIAAFTLWITLSTVFAMNFDAAFVKWNQVIKIMAVCIVTLILINSRTRLEGAIWVVVISIGFFSLKGGVFAILSGGSSRVYGPQESLIAENNAMALATIAIVPLFVFLRSTVKNRWIRLGMLGGIPVMVISALASYSRGALLAMCAMSAFLWLKSRHKAALGVGVVVVALIGVNFMPQQWFERMDTIQTYDEDASALGRLNAWAMGFNLALHHPILGGGFTVYETVPSVWEKYAPVPEDTHAAHSIYFEVLAYHGFVGFFMFLAIGFITFRDCSFVLRRTRDRPDFQRARDLAGMVQVSLVGYATGGAFLNLAFYDLLWQIIAIGVVNRLVAEKELAVALYPVDNAADRPANAESPVPAAPRTAEPRRSFLRRDEPAGSRQRSFLKNSR